MADLASYGPWALITGASSGIGRAFSLEIARAGLSIAVSGRNRGTLEELERELTDEGSPAVRVLPCDMGDPDAVRHLSDELGSVDVGLVVASAGFGSSGPFLDSDPVAEANMVDVNCRALMQVAHTFGRRMLHRDHAGLVLMSSIVAFQGAPFATNYAATKAYVQSLAEGIAYETRGRGLRVVACATGPVSSGFAARARMNMANAQSPESVAKGTLANLSRGGTSRPGALSKFLSGSLSTLPRWGRVRVMAKIMGGMAESSPSDVVAPVAGAHR